MGRELPDDPGSFDSSPHLVQVRERIRINGQPISSELFTKHFWRLYHQLEETKVLVPEGWWMARVGDLKWVGRPRGCCASQDTISPSTEAAVTPSSDVILSTGRQ